MSGGFSFPPPPPPPPRKPTEPSVYESAPSGFGRGRGGVRGRGQSDGFTRGRPYGRGQGVDPNGQRNYEAMPRVQDSDHHASTDYQSQTFGTLGSMQTQSSERPDSRTFSGRGLPPGSYVNPNFAPVQHNANRPDSWPRPVGAVPDGATGSYLASNNPHGYAGGARIFDNSALSAGPPRTPAGHKRKLEAFRTEQGPRERRQGGQAPPAVPNFVGPVVPAIQSPAPGRLERPIERPPPKGKGGSSNALGLTPAEDPQYEQSDDEDMDVDGDGDGDVDEEAMYAELGTKLTFEHNGVVTMLNSEADLAAWREERRKKWPTDARIASKEDQRRQIGQERKRLLSSAAALHSPAAVRRQASRLQKPTVVVGKPSDIETEVTKSTEAVPTETSGQSELEQVRSRLEEEGKKLDVLRKQVSEKEATLAAAQKAHEEADDHETSPVPAADISSKEVVRPHKTLPGISMEDTDEESEPEHNDPPQPPLIEAEPPSGEETDDDGPPEATSSRASDPSRPASTLPLCRYFTASGRCRDGDACRFRHDPSVVRPQPDTRTQVQQQQQQPRPAPRFSTSNRKSIHQLLVEQEDAETDRLALQVIQYLGQSGFFN